MTQKEYRAMTDVELIDALSVWEAHVENATGWASAYFAATQVKAIVSEGSRRGITLINRYPVVVG